uniref:Uncharacterized protein n=1 Tax=Manihot esculenta TaxID=3983 RepID=A0A2C9WP74_MANES
MQLKSKHDSCIHMLKCPTQMEQNKTQHLFSKNWLASFCMNHEDFT